MADNENGSSFPESVSLDDFERTQEESKAPAVDPNAPTAEQVAEENKKLKQALQISEDARLALRKVAETPTPAPAAPVEPAKEEGPTREELAELMREDPASALEIIERRTEQRLAAHFSNRFTPYANAAIESAQVAAQAKYKEEFELFGDDIKDFIKQVPDKSQLANSESWDQMISYIRGRPGNFEKLLESRIGKSSTNAREEQIASTGFSGTTRSSATTLPKSGKVQLDDTQREICRVAGWSEAEYIKYMGGN